MNRPFKPSRIIGSLLRESRKQAGLTQQQVANSMECLAPRISRLETGKIVPELDTIHKLAKACGRDFVMILATENDKQIINKLNHNY